MSNLQATVTLQPSESAPTINPNIYGHFSEHLGRCIYEGFWVGEDSPIPNTRGIRNDVVQALRAIKVPVLRWPGGCFADEYHWMDGIGPRESRPGIYNSHWGGVVESNHFGTHEFLDLCDQLGTKPYICGNVGSGTIKEMQDWVEYMTSDASSPMANLRRKNGQEKAWKIPYFGVGNESWGCGGSMRPEYYADEYRRYNTFVRNYSGNQIYRIACGANNRDTNWTKVLMERAGNHMNGLSVHNYTLNGGKWPPSGLATEFDFEGWVDLLSHAFAMDSLIQGHIDEMDKVDPDKKVGMIVDEWGTWFAPEPGTNPGFLYQQNSMRDAMVAAIHFHIFHHHADRITMANIAQTVNVLQAMILTDGPRMLRTPTYWAFEMYQVHQGGQQIPLDIQTPNTTVSGSSIPTVSATASQSDATYISLINADPTSAVTVRIGGLADPVLESARILVGESLTSHNTFDDPDRVSPQAFTGYRVDPTGLDLELPPASIVTIKVEL
ncbi:MAG: alpha-N-arabinofuranosidase, partial [Fimbriimonas sp.]